MCLPPECLHMLCVGGFMAVPPLARIPHRLGVRGQRGALYSWPAGPAQPCHPPAEKLHTHPNTHRHIVYLDKHTVRYTLLARQPAQMPMQDNPVGIDASLSKFENKRRGGTGYYIYSPMKQWPQTQDIILSFFLHCRVSNDVLR